MLFSLFPGLLLPSVTGLEKIPPLFSRLFLKLSSQLALQLSRSSLRCALPAKKLNDCGTVVSASLNGTSKG